MSKFAKIMHLDAGRMYFRVKSLKMIIDSLAACGYDQLQLAIGNDGLRFLLDDMAMDGKDSDTVKELVKQGNIAYNGNPSCLTQSEMDEVIAYADQKGIEIVPMVNSPGHMPAALAINPSYRLVEDGKTSDNSLDVRREDAVAFGIELIRKYAAYFSSKGCRHFNFGADEYGNDVFNLGGLGFYVLETRGEFSYMVNYLNRASEAVLEYGMVPRAFNDPFYYHEDTQMVLNPAVEVCYWIKGWCGFDCAAVDTIAKKGHPMINCHGAWYYVLLPDGRVQKASEHPDFDKFDAKIFPSDQVCEDVAGAMICFWCDNSTLRTDEQVAEDAAVEMKALYEKFMKD